MHDEDVTVNFSQFVRPPHVESCISLGLKANLAASDIFLFPVDELFRSRQMCTQADSVEFSNNSV